MCRRSMPPHVLTADSMHIKDAEVVENVVTLVGELAEHGWTPRCVTCTDGCRRHAGAAGGEGRDGGADQSQDHVRQQRGAARGGGCRDETAQDVSALIEEVLETIAGKK